MAPNFKVDYGPTYMNDLTSCLSATFPNLSNLILAFFGTFVIQWHLSVWLIWNSSCLQKHWRTGLRGQRHSQSTATDPRGRCQKGWRGGENGGCKFMLTCYWLVLYRIKGNEKFYKHPGFEKVRSYSARVRKFLTKNTLRWFWRGRKIWNLEKKKKNKQTNKFLNKK